MEDEPALITCVRCGRSVPAEPPRLLPDDWEGKVSHPNAGARTVSEAVCPGCRFVEWHPHCTSLVTWEGERVDPKVDWAEMPREEWDFGALTRCDYIDLTVSWIEDADCPRKWTCPECGGTEFDGVHRDYPSSRPLGGFTVERD